MAYDPTWPEDHAHAAAAKFRQQFTGLKDLIDAVPAGPPGPPGPPGADGAQGPQGDAGPPGPPLSSPFPGAAIFQGNIVSDGGSLFIATSDAGGSGETSVRLAVSSSAGGPLLNVTSKVNGAEAGNVSLDPSGLIDGAGVTSVEDHDLLSYDAGAAAWKPKRGLASQFTSLSPLALTVSDPPTQAEVQAVADRLDEILSRLQA